MLKNIIETNKNTILISGTRDLKQIVIDQLSNVMIIKFSKQFDDE